MCRSYAHSLKCVRVCAWSPVRPLASLCVCAYVGVCASVQTHVSVCVVTGVAPEPALGQDLLTPLAHHALCPGCVCCRAQAQQQRTPLQWPRIPSLTAQVAPPVLIPKHCRSGLFGQVWGHTHDSQGLVLALHSGIPLGGAQGTQGVPWIKLESAVCQASALSALILLWPQNPLPFKYW